jgi:hypothetical protein
MSKKSFEGRLNNVRANLLSSDNDKRDTQYHRKVSKGYKSSILTEKGWAGMSKGNGYFPVSPELKPKHLREFKLSGVIASGVRSTRENIKQYAPQHFEQIWKHHYPRLNMCWSNSRYYIAFNDVEHPDATYIYEEGWFIVQKMIDGTWEHTRGFELAHHGRVRVINRYGEEHIIDLTFKNAIPLITHDYETTQQDEAAYLMSGDTSLKACDEERTAVHVAARKQLFEAAIERVHQSGLIDGEEVLQVKKQLNNIIKSASQDQRYFHTNSDSPFDPVPPTKQERAARANRRALNRRRNKMSKKSRRSNRRAA